MYVYGSCQTAMPILIANIVIDLVTAGYRTKVPAHVVEKALSRSQVGEEMGIKRSVITQS